MFDFVRHAKLAVGDTVRRAALKAVAGVVALAAFGFLTAALWSWLATDLDWGSTLASLAIAGGLLLVALILMAMSSRQRHRMPSSDDMRREVSARVALATDAAVGKVRSEATKVVDLAESKATALMGQASDRASRFAGDAEERLFGTVRDTARAVGLTSGNIHAAKDRLHDAAHTVRVASDSNPGSMAKLIGAFAVGVTLAAAIRERRGGYDDDYDDLT